MTTELILHGVRISQLHWSATKGPRTVSPTMARKRLFANVSSIGSLPSMYLAAVQSYVAKITPV